MKLHGPQPRIIGIRHHSPACAKLVAHAIAEDRPALVLIEGPSDFNSRIPELLLDHRLPIALYSFVAHENHVARCQFPLADYSPEWIALKHGHACGALLRFIDLPHWQTRALTDQERLHRLNSRLRLEPSQYQRVTQALGERLASDNHHTLWDHLFESETLDGAERLGALEVRLATYFHALRGEPAHNGSEQDTAREALMAHWIAWAMQHAGNRNVLVVCGGWHKRALESLWPQCEVQEEPLAPQPDAGAQAGVYLTPYDFAQLDALSGYASGMQSPKYYQWLANDGLENAAARATQAIITRLRARRLPVNTADVLAFKITVKGLANMRGHAQPLRADILDAAQSAFIKEALSEPTPWSTEALLSHEQHPVVIETLRALSGDETGALAGDTPLPPIVADVQARLAACGLNLPKAPDITVLDRRQSEDTRRAQTLWQLQLIGASGVRLESMAAPHSARHLLDELLYEEHWQLEAHPKWLPSLIEAAAHGPTLDSAARSALMSQLAAAAATAGPPQPVQASRLAEALCHAMRAGFFDLGETLASTLTEKLALLNDHGELARSATLLLNLSQAGFWGRDLRPLLINTLAAMGKHLLWLVEGLEMAAPSASSEPAQQEPGAVDADIVAIQAVAGLLQFVTTVVSEGAMLDASLESEWIQASVLRWARQTKKPSALRGASAGLCVALTQGSRMHPGLSTVELTAMARGLSPSRQLGDFLFGVFALTREVMQENDSLLDALHSVLCALNDEDFLIALPALRAAFTWFPPRERGRIARQAARLLGLDIKTEGQAIGRLMQLRQGAESYLKARQIEAQALAWAKAYGLDALDSTSH